MDKNTLRRAEFAELMANGELESSRNDFTDHDGSQVARRLQHVAGSTSPQALAQLQAERQAEMLSQAIIKKAEADVVVAQVATELAAADETHEG